MWIKKYNLKIEQQEEKGSVPYKNSAHTYPKLGTKDYFKPMRSSKSEVVD